MGRCPCCASTRSSGVPVPPWGGATAAFARPSCCASCRASLASSRLGSRSAFVAPGWSRARVRAMRGLPPRLPMRRRLASPSPRRYMTSSLWAAALPAWPRPRRRVRRARVSRSSIARRPSAASCASAFTTALASSASQRSSPVRSSPRARLPCSTASTSGPPRACSRCIPVPSTSLRSCAPEALAPFGRGPWSSRAGLGSAALARSASLATAPRESTRQGLPRRSSTCMGACRGAAPSSSAPVTSGSSWRAA